ncbi:hypothetical protein [Spirosoma sp. 48-14]|uniref:hypothetical protein n=1 Tax=Spirosoma sp. 48-14 TaxID=1895854 RepID=UPI0009691F2B|nr:hypothetical protein [Spirosoma sp. 48-14]OJW76270.1 MAG: hypothetical protein BGO59_22385 [Spirosoma sp. 48-14]
MFRPVLLLFLGPLLFFACSSGQTALRHGHYDLAVKRASYRLQQGPGLTKRGHRLAADVIKQAFVRAYEAHQTAIRKLSTTGDTDSFRWEKVYREYEQLQSLTDNARRAYDSTCTTCSDWLASYPVSYQDRQQDTRQLAAADRYDVAEQAFIYREENRLAAKDAYQNYLKASDWVPDYRQAKAKAAEAFEFAILRVVVEPLGPTRELDRSDNQELQTLILRKIRQNTRPSTFVQLYPIEGSIGEPIVGDGFPIHQAVQMQVTDYMPYREAVTSSSATVYSNQSYKVGEKKINDSTKVDIMQKVSGTLTTYVRTITTGLTLQIRAIDTQTGKVIWDDPISESQSWQTEWQTFTGDNRALNGQSLKSASLFAPSRWQLYSNVRDELVDDVARRLRTHYQRD